MLGSPRFGIGKLLHGLLGVEAAGAEEASVTTWRTEVSSNCSERRDDEGKEGAQERRLVMARGKGGARRGVEVGAGEDVSEGGVGGLLVRGEVVEMAGGDVGADCVAAGGLVVGGGGGAEKRHGRGRRVGGASWRARLPAEGVRGRGSRKEGAWRVSMAGDHSSFGRRPGAGRD